MNLIACDKHCIHQRDGYCNLEKITFVTSSKENGCLHYIDSDKISPQKQDAIGFQISTLE